MRVLPGLRLISPLLSRWRCVQCCLFHKRVFHAFDGLLNARWTRSTWSHARMSFPIAASDEARARAEAAFRKGQQARDSTGAWTEYEKQARATEEKIARLCALHLAKEAAAKSPKSG